MQNQTVSMDATLDALRRAQFAVIDVLRRTQGNTLGAFGLSPTECPYRIVASGQQWRLRDYAEHEASSSFLSLLIVAAPIKRPYIWDLAPSTSAIRYCLREHLHIFLLEWLPASRRSGNNGLVEYAQAISECVVKVSKKPKVQSRSSSVIHSVARSRPYIVHWHPKASAASCFSEHRFVSSRTQAVFGMHSSL